MGIISFTIAFFIVKKKKKDKTLKSKTEAVEIKQNISFPNNKIEINGSSKENLKYKNNHLL